MGCIEITADAPNHCIEVTAESPSHCIEITSTEQDSKCNVSIPIPKFQLIDSGYGISEYDDDGYEFIYEKHDVKIRITNLRYILDLGLNYNMSVGGGNITNVDTNSGIITWHTPSKYNGASTVNQVSLSVNFYDECSRYTNRNKAYNLEKDYEYALIHKTWGGSGFVPFPTEDIIDGKHAFRPYPIGEGGSSKYILANIIYLFDNNDKVKKYFRGGSGYLSEDGYKLNGCRDGRYCHDVTSIDIDKKVGHLTGDSSYVYHWDLDDKSPTPRLLYCVPTFIEIQGTSYIVRRYIRFPNTPLSRQVPVNGRYLTIDKPQCLNSIKILYNDSEVGFSYSSGSSTSMTIRLGSQYFGEVTVISPRPEHVSTLVQNSTYIDEKYCT